MDGRESDILKLIKEKSTRKEGFSLLLDCYQEALYFMIRRMVISHEDAKDILQETFLRIWKNLDGFREESKLYTWMYRIAINEAMRFMEKKKRMLNDSADLEDMLLQKLESDTWINGDEAQIRLQKAILSLPPKQRMVFNMRYFDEMPYEKIAAILNTSVESLKVSFHHARKKIEALIKHNAI